MRQAAVIAVAALCLAGCAGAPVLDEAGPVAASAEHEDAPGREQETRLPASPPFDSPPGIVFLVHGIWPDGGWVADAARALRSRGIATLPVEYTCFAPGMFLEYGTDEPAARVLDAARRLRAAHDRTRCRAPLLLHSIGFSAGTIVTLKAARRGVRFETAHMGGSPIFCGSSDLADAVRAREIALVVNHVSPVDGVVWGLLGMGQLGYWGGHDGETLPIRDVSSLYWHMIPPFDEELTGEIADGWLAEARKRGDPPHVCWRDAAFRAEFERAAERLAEVAPPSTGEFKAEPRSRRRPAENDFSQ